MSSFSPALSALFDMQAAVRTILLAMGLPSASAVRTLDAIWTANLGGPLAPAEEIDQWRAALTTCQGRLAKSLDSIRTELDTLRRQ